MLRLLPLACFALLLLGTAATGYVQGRITNRWGARPSAQQAADLLKQPLPQEAGSWRLEEESELPPAAARMLQYPTCVNRSYVHQQTGDRVRMFVLVGHPGPVSVHTPEVCYSSQDYSIAADRAKVVIETDGQHSHEFWELPLKPKHALHHEPLRVFYAWSTGSRWEAAAQPRFGYGGLPHLYKLQIAVETNAGSKAKDFDPGQDFLRCFLDQLQSRMVEARSSASSR